MKGLMATLLILSYTGTVCAQQNYNTGRRTGDVNNSSLNNQGPPIVPIVSGEDSSTAAGSGARDASTGARGPLATSQGGAFGGTSNRSVGATSSGGSFGGSPSRPVEATPSRSFGTSPNNRSLEASRGTDTPWANPAPVVRKNFPNRETGLTQVGVRRTDTTALSGGSRSGASRSALQTDGDKVIYLGLPASQLDNLQRFGSVEADVKNPYVDRITISDQDRPKATPVRTIEPVLQGDKLIFRFDEQQISHLADYSFEFNVPEYMKGKYTKAVIEYPPALQRVSQTQTNPRVGTDFRAEDNRWRLAGDRSTGPSVDSLELERQRQLELQRQMYETNHQRSEYERLQREREASQYAEQKRLLDSRQYEEQLARMRYEQEQAANLARQATLSAPSLLSTTTTPTWPSLLSNRYADRRFDGSSMVTQPAIVTQPVVPQSDNTLVVSMMQNMMRSMEDRVAQLNTEMSSVKSENNDLRRRFEHGYGYQMDLANTGRVHHTTGVETEQRPQISQRTPLSTGRLEVQQRGRQDVALSNKMEGKTAKPRSRGSWDLLMFLMLLASVALNLYLWAVSRGFYMRYQELADELRETFAVTSS